MELQHLLKLTDIQKIQESLEKEKNNHRTWIRYLTAGIKEAELRKQRYVRSSLSDDGEDEQVFINRLKQIRKLYYMKIKHIEEEVLYLNGL